MKIGIAALSFSFCVCAVAQTNTINTFAGSITLGAGFGGDNGPAVSAQLNLPKGVAVDSSGNVYIADSANAVVRQVSTNGVITTIAGTGTSGFGGDGASAILAQLGNPTGVAVDSGGNVYVADATNNRIRKISAGFITTIAGGTAGFSGDSGPAVNAQLNFPAAVAVDTAGNVYIADAGNHRIRKVSNGIISTVAGNGSPGFGGDGGPGASAQLFTPQGVAVDSQGNVYIADTNNNRIRKLAGGLLTTIAGTGFAGYTGDKGLATSAQVATPVGVTVDAAGNVFVADTGNSVIRKISGLSISTVAGTGGTGYSGDNGPAQAAVFFRPAGVAVDGAGGLAYIADTQNSLIRVLTNPVVTGVIPHFAAGSGYVTGLYVVNKDSQPAGFTINFFDDTGKSVSVPSGSGSISALTDTIPGLGTGYYELGTASSQALVSGSATITSGSSIVVQSLFRRLVSGNVYYEAALPSSPGALEIEIAFDSTIFAATGARIYTGIAIANLDSGSPATLTCVARDNAGTVIPNAVTVPALTPQGHWAAYDFPALYGKRGTLDCTSTNKVGAIALRVLGSDAISTLPVIVK